MIGLAGRLRMGSVGGPFFQGFLSGAKGSGNTLSVSDVPIGAANAARTVVIALAWNAKRTNVTVSSATIGGVSATIRHTTSPAGFERTAFLIAVVPTGTSAQVNVTFSNTFASGGSYALASYRVLNLSGYTHAADAHQGTTNIYSASVTLNNPGDGIIAVCATGAYDGTAAAWTNVEEDFLVNPYDGISNYDVKTSGSAVFTSPGSKTVTLTGDATSTFGTLIVLALLF